MEKKINGSPIGLKIKSLRDQNDLNQAEFAARLGVSQRTVSRIERGERTPDYDLLVRIQDEFGVAADYLLRERAEPYKAMPENGVTQRLENLERLITTFLLSSGSRGAVELAGHVFGRHMDEIRIPLHDMGQDGKVDTQKPPAAYAARPVGLIDKAAYAVRLADDSMMPEFRPGDILVFSPAERAESGHYASIALDDGTIFRQLFIVGDGTARLVALNRNYPELRLKETDIFSAHKLVSKTSTY